MVRFQDTSSLFIIAYYFPKIAYVAIVKYQLALMWSYADGIVKFCASHKVK